MGRLACLFSDTVDALDLAAFYARYAGVGAWNQPFHAAMMVKALAASPNTARSATTALCT